MSLLTLVDDRLAPSERDPGEPLVADSWLVADGVVRAPDLHRARFDASCQARGVPGGSLRAFWNELPGWLPETGMWFPRAELSASHRLHLWVRPAPGLGTELTVWPSPGPDPRADPRTKGPDLAVLRRLRERAAAHGAGEALLTSAEGWVLEGATTSLLWWDGDALCLPATELPLLPGITSRLLVDIARAEGVRVWHRLARLEDLDGRETWMVNALHGLRPVTSWAGCPLRAAPAVRASRWAARLNARTTRVHRQGRAL